MGLYNLEYFSAAVLVSPIFKTPLICEPCNKIGTEELDNYIKIKNEKKSL
jgi:hypothetical protein